MELNTNLSTDESVEGKVKASHQALEDFNWLFNDISSRPTQLVKLIPLAAATKNRHNVFDTGVGWV